MRNKRLENIKEQYRALQEAAKPLLEGIEAKAHEASPSTRAYLETIHQALFADGLTVKALEEEHGNYTTSVKFHEEVGTPPGKFIIDYRIETGRRLLMSTDFSIPVISKLVQLSLSTFRRNFKRLHGQSPSDYQRTAGVRLKDSKGVGIETEYFDSQNPVPELHLRIHNTEWEELAAQWLVRALLKLDHGAAIREMSFLSCDSPRVFEILEEKGRSLGRQERRRGVEVATLALLAVENNSAVLGKITTPTLRALALASLGNARCQASDYEGAERELRKAETALDDIPEETRAGVEAEILGYWGALRSRQRRFEEAREVLVRAASMAQVAKDKSREALIHAQVASLMLYQEDLRGACDALERARDLVENDDVQTDQFHRLVIHFQLAHTYVLARNIDEAEQLLPSIWQLVAELGHRQVLHQTQWIEAMIHSLRGDLAKAESRLRQAREGFFETEDPDHAAIATLDLALLCEKQGRSDEAFSLAKEVLAFFESSHLPEALAARELLHRAFKQTNTVSDVLQKIRGFLVEDGSTGLFLQNRLDPE